MRIALLALLACSCSCGGDTQAGAYLQVDGIPKAAVELEVILAGQPTIVAGQHTGQSFTGSATVPYYAQRWSSGGLSRVTDRDSMLVQIEPSLDPTAATELVPIVIARSTAGDDATILAMATLPGSNGPATMDLAVTSAAIYETTLEAAEPMAGGKPATGQVARFACGAEGLGGYAWMTGSGSELRIVRPADHGSGDGSALPLDLDCDRIAANEGDCDDLNSDVLPGAPEKCDGVDSDCQGDELWTGSCGSDSAVVIPDCTVGRQLCDEEDPSDDCYLAPSATCGSGSDGSGVSGELCRLDLLGTDPNGGAEPCAPAQSPIQLPQPLCLPGPCVIRVANSGAWTGEVATTSDGVFADTAPVSANGGFWLRVKQTASTATGSGGPVGSGPGSGSGGPVPTGEIGVIDLFVTDTGSAGTTGAEQYFGVGLLQTTGHCNNFGQGTGDGSDLYTMDCSTSANQ